jgi:hypothetical protein
MSVMVCKGKIMAGITIVPKPTPKKKKKPETLVVDAEKINLPFLRTEISADDAFWEDWDLHHFDIGLALVFMRRILSLKQDEIVKFTDGKSVVIAKRTGEESGVLMGGYQLRRIYTQEWAEAHGYHWASHRQVRISLDHKRHFVDRYRKRKFNLALMGLFIGKAPMVKLGQRIKIVGKDDIFIGTRTSKYGAIVITGMKRGEIKLGDYVDYKIGGEDD